MPLCKMLNPLAVFICRIFFHVGVSGTDNLPEKGGFILASNHISYLDPVILAVASPRKLNFMAKRELFRNRLIGPFLMGLGAFPVKRDSADLSALKEAIRRLRQGLGLVLFPEGSRGFGTQAQEPQAGIGFLAAKTAVPVVPAFIKGTDLALPRGARRIKAARISVSFGKQILAERRMPYRETAGLIMARIRHLSCPQAE